MPGLHPGVPLRSLFLNLLRRAALKRRFQTFTYRDALYRMLADGFESACSELVARRNELEAFIRRCPLFARSYVPIALPDDAPPTARQMADAARRVQVGPMAAVAGAFAEAAARRALATGTEEAIVDNGGDLYLKLVEPALIGLYTGDRQLSQRLAFRIEPDETPLAVCSSSGRMGHSHSLGACDLATVTAGNAALADAAATRTANQVRAASDIDAALESISAVDGIRGVLIVKDGRIGMAGRLPHLVRCRSA